MRIATRVLPGEDEVGGRRGAVHVEVHDSAFPNHEGYFVFWWTDDGPIGAFYMIRVRREADLARAEAERRGIPVHRWRTAARAALMLDRAPRFDREGRLVAAGTDEALSETDRRYLAIAQEYRANMAAGNTKPVTEIALRHGVEPAAARNWVRRARERGLLGPTMRRSRDPGSIEAVLGEKDPIGWEE